MSDQRTRCLFCFASSAAFPKLTREHVVSRPVADAFGVDRESPFAKTNADGSDVRWGVVGGLSRRVVCAPCNNGWMNALEHKMAEAATWLGTWNEPLGEERDLVVRSWALKTHLLLCHSVGRAAELGVDGVEDAVIAPYTAARQLFEGDTAALGRLAVALARTAEPEHFMYAFGTPTLVRTGPNHLNALTAPVSIITVGSLQLWIATPLVDASVFFPRGVALATPSLRMRQLRTKPPLGDLDAIRVDYGEHDARALREHLESVARGHNEGHPLDRGLDG